MSRVTKAVIAADNIRLRRLFAMAGDENRELRSENDELRADNDKLRAQIAELHHTQLADLRMVFTNYADAATAAKRTAVDKHRSVRVVRSADGFVVRVKRRVIADNVVIGVLFIGALGLVWLRAQGLI